MIRAGDLIRTRWTGGDDFTIETVDLVLEVIPITQEHLRFHGKKLMYMLRTLDDGGVSEIFLYKSDYVEVISEPR